MESIKYLLLSLSFVSIGFSATEKKGFDFGHLLFHHLIDTHDWHITDIPLGNGKKISIAIHLPYIVYDSEHGLRFFFLHGHNHEEKAKEAQKMGYHLDEYGHIRALPNSNKTVIDFSLTKSSLQMILVGLLMLWLFTTIARRYERNPNSPPKGIQSFFEPIILFIKEEIAEPYLGNKANAFLPYLLTLGFFIWFANLLGLTPFNFNITGSISVTAALAVLTFILTQWNGSKDYWHHIFWFPGVPLLVKFIMIPVEILGVFTKPFALAVRLFANITAGHCMVLGLVGLIFVMYLGKGTENFAGAVAIMPLSILFTLVIYSIEIIVAAVQAYIFALLTAVFIGMAMEEHHH